MSQNPNIESQQKRDALPLFNTESIEAYHAFLEQQHVKLLDFLWNDLVHDESFRQLLQAIGYKDFINHSLSLHQHFINSWESGDWKDYNRFIQEVLQRFVDGGTDYKAWSGLIFEFKSVFPSYLQSVYSEKEALRKKIVEGANAVADFTLHNIQSIYLISRDAQIKSERARSERVQTDLRNSQERLKAIFESTSDHLLAVDREARITMINHTAPGLKVEEVIGTSIYDYQDAATNQRVATALHSVFNEKQSVTYESEYQASAQEKYLYSNSAAPIYGSDGEVHEAVIVSRDITKKRKLENERSGLFEVIKRSLNEIYMFAPDTLKFQFVNEGALKNLGYSEAEITGLTPLDLKPEFSESSFYALLSKLKQSEDKKVKFETYHKRKDGSLYDVEVHLQLVPYHNREIYLAVINDITDRNNNQRRLDQSLDELRNVQERLELSIEGSSAGLWDWNLRTDEVFFSSRFKSLLGYEPNELENKFLSFYNAVYYADRRRALQALTDSLDDSKPFDITFRLQLKDGDYRWFIARASVLFTDEGVPYRMAGSIADINERVQAELQLENLNRNLEKIVEERTAELREINRELESFSYSVSHDLRTPLRAISGFARILSEKAKENLNDEQQRFLQVIRENVVSMDQLIDDLLAYSKMGKAHVVPRMLDMNEVVDQVLEEILGPDDAGRIRINTEHLPKVKADQELIKRVWSNLLGNAVKFSKEKETPEIRIFAEERPDEIIYSVQDNGAGFNMRYANKLFRIFQRLHNQNEFPGTGVGLAIVNRIVSKHGGEVWAEGKPGLGATFSFSIPQKKA